MSSTSKQKQKSLLALFAHGITHHLRLTAIDYDSHKCILLVSTELIFH